MANGIRTSLLDPMYLNALYVRINNLQVSDGALWGVMTSAQMICHLSDGLRVALGIKETKDRSNILLNKVFRIWLRLPIAIPRFSKTFPEADQKKKGTKPGDFEGDKAKLKQLMYELSENKNVGKLYPHPIFGNLSFEDWNIMAAKHIDYHLKQFGK